MVRQEEWERGGMQTQVSSIEYRVTHPKRLCSLCEGHCIVFEGGRRISNGRVIHRRGESERGRESEREGERAREREREREIERTEVVQRSLTPSHEH